MKTRIVVSYLSEWKYDEIGDIDLDNSKYALYEVKNIEEGLKEIVKNEINGCGEVTEQYKDRYGWHDLRQYHVSEGVIFEYEIFD